MVGCLKEMIFTYIDSSDISLSNGANRSSLSRFIQKLLKKHQGLLYFETDISLVSELIFFNITGLDWWRNCNFAKCEFRQLANFPQIFAILKESSRNQVRVLDMLTDQTELAMIYESRTVKNTIGEITESRTGAMER